jgi:hypothetical protein
VNHHGDAVAVHRSSRERAQDEQVERTLHQRQPRWRQGGLLPLRRCGEC